MVWILGKLTMIKSWLYALALFIVGIICALFVGKTKQYNSDRKKVKTAVDDELNRISKARENVAKDIESNNSSDPDSSSKRLRDDWSER